MVDYNGLFPQWASTTLKITAGVAGGVSAVLATTDIARGGQMIGNAIISGANSMINGNSASDIIVDTCMGCGVGFFGGSGTGYGGLYFGEKLRRKDLLLGFGKGFVNGSLVSNIRNFTNLATKKLEDLYNFFRKR